MTRRVVWSVVLAGLAVAVVAAAVLVPVLGLRTVARRSAPPGYVADAREAAKSCAVNLMSIDYRTVDRNIERLLAGSTGDFHRQYVDGRAKLRQATIDNHVRSTGTVRSLALSEAAPTRAIALVAVDARIVNDTQPKGRTAHYRMRVTVEPVRGRWLVSEVSFVS